MTDSRLAMLDHVTEKTFRRSGRRAETLPVRRRLSSRGATDATKTSYNTLAIHSSDTDSLAIEDSMTFTCELQRIIINELEIRSAT